MRVDKDWQEGIGKKLYDFEGDLAPDTWNNINKRIKPRRSKTYRWLPVLIIFLALPPALYFADPFHWLNNENQQSARNSMDPNPANEEPTNTKTVAVSGKKVAAASGIHAAENESNTADSDTQITESGDLTAKPERPTRAPGMILAGKENHQKNKPAKELLATLHLDKALPAAEWKDRTGIGEMTLGSADPENKSIRSGNKPAGALALYKPGKSQAEKGAEKLRPSAEGLDKTVGSLQQNPEIILNNKMSEIIRDKKAIQDNYNVTESATVQKKDLAYLDSKNTLIATSQNAAAFKNTLPDSLKKELLATLPDPGKDETQKADKLNNQLTNWNFSVYGSPNYAFQRVLPNRQDGLSILKMENKNAFDSKRIGFEFGARAYYTLRKNIQISFGFQFASIKQHLRLNTIKIQPDSVSIKQQNNASSMQIYNSPRLEEYLFKYYFGGINTGINLQLTKKLDLAGGLGVNWLLQSSSNQESKNIANAAFNPYLNLGLHYKQPLNHNLTFITGPTMQYYLQPVQEKHTFIGVKPNIFGFSAGLLYKPR